MPQSIAGEDGQIAPFTTYLAKFCKGASAYARESQGTVYVINVRLAGVKANQERNAT